MQLTLCQLDKSLQDKRLKSASLFMHMGIFLKISISFPDSWSACTWLDDETDREEALEMTAVSLSSWQAHLQTSENEKKKNQIVPGAVRAKKIVYADAVCVCFQT